VVALLPDGHAGNELDEFREWDVDPVSFEHSSRTGAETVELVVPVFQASRPGILYAKCLAYAAFLTGCRLFHP